MTVTINRDTVSEFNELLDDTIQFFCQEYQTELISGETAWKMMACYAEAKLAEMNGELA